MISQDRRVGYLPLFDKRDTSRDAIWHEELSNETLRERRKGRRERGEGEKGIG